MPVTATATDNVGVTAVDLEVDGSTVATDTSAPYNFGWTAAAGPHTLRTVAHDAAGNSGNSGDVHVTVTAGDTTDPTTTTDTQDPTDWWSALESAVRVAVTDEMTVRGIAVAGQQHGFVSLDSEGNPVRPAPLWNNVASAPDAERLNEQADFAAAIGSRLVASFTITKLAHLARTSPEDLAQVHAICLPHDYLNYRLTRTLATDRSEASGSGWWSPATGEIRRDLLALAAGSHSRTGFKCQPSSAQMRSPAC